MAKEKKSGGGVGGCLVQIVLGVLAAIATILAVLFFMSGPFEASEDGHTTADDAAAGVIEPEVLPETPAPKAEVAPQVPQQHDAGLDPSSDDQIAEDAAAAGMTSRTPSKEGE